MKTHSYQRGMSIPGMLMWRQWSVFVMCAVRMVPHYFEYLSIREIVTTIAQEYNREEQSIPDIRRRIDTMFNTNQIYDLQPKDVEVYTKEAAPLSMPAMRRGCPSWARLTP